MSRQYRTVKDRAVSPLLKLVLVNPRVGRYVTMMDVRDMEGSYTGRNEYNDDEFHSIRLAVAEAKEHFSGVDVENLLCPTSDGYYRRGLGVALLLLHLPNLNVIRFHALHTVPLSWVEKFIANASRAAKPVLPKLKKIQIHSQFGYGLARLLQFAALPSLQELSASYSENFYSHKVKVLSPASEITKLELCDSFVDSETLCIFLRSFCKLETFTFSTEKGQERPKFDAPLLRNALLTQAKMTLRTLTILGPPERFSFMGSLRDFKVLTKLHTLWVLLLPPMQAQLSVVLPKSLCHLRLHDPEFHNAAIYKRLLLDTLRAKASRILHLEHLTFVVPKGCEHYENYLYRQDCRENGLDVTFVHEGLEPVHRSLYLL